MDHKLNKKDMALLKGAIRRWFARTEKHRQVLDAAYVEHSDPERPRVKSWRRCAICGKLDAKSYFVVDHITPVIQIHETLEDLTPIELFERIDCDISNLQAADVVCHKLKTLEENKQRRAYKKSLAKKI